MKKSQINKGDDVVVVFKKDVVEATVIGKTRSYVDVKFPDGNEGNYQIGNVYRSCDKDMAMTKVRLGK